MGWFIHVKPCCYHCLDFIPPWALREEWTGQAPDIILKNNSDTGMCINCIHHPVCGRFAAEPDVEAK